MPPKVRHRRADPTFDTVILAIPATLGCRFDSYTVHVGI